MSETKRNALLLLAIAGFLILLLAMSLPNLRLSPGQPFSLGQPQPETGWAGVQSSGSDVLLLVFRGIIGLSLILLPPYIILSLLSKEGRRRLITYVIMIVLLLLLAEYLRNRPINEDGQEQEQTAAAPQDLSGLETGLPAAVFQPTPPVWLTPVVILVASVVVVVFLFTVIRYVQRRARPPVSSLTKLADEAQNAIETLQAGGDFKLTVIHCYQEMSRIVKEEKGIERDADMTPREFESRLMNKGLPQESIRTLTRLFEQVRYGSITPGTHEENLAFSSLTEIVNACRFIGEQA